MRFLPFLFSLGLHGVMASFLLLSRQETTVEHPFVATVEWRHASEEGCSEIDNVEKICPSFQKGSAILETEEIQQMVAMPQDSRFRGNDTPGDNVYISHSKKYSSNSLEGEDYPPEPRMLSNPNPQLTPRAKTSESRKEVQGKRRADTGKSITTSVIASPQGWRSNSVRDKNPKLLRFAPHDDQVNTNNNSQPPYQALPCGGKEQRKKSLVSDNASLNRKILKKSYQPLPEYPWICRKRGQTGRVSLEVQTNGGGHVIKVKLHKSSGHSSLDQAALSAAKEWIFPEQNCHKRISISFLLKD